MALRWKVMAMMGKNESGCISKRDRRKREVHACLFACSRRHNVHRL
jgi:hypothetical protein